MSFVSNFIEGLACDSRASRMEFIRIRLVVLLGLLSSDWISQACGAVSAREYFDEADMNLELIVKKIEENVGNQCALLKTCDAVANCSRYDCSYDVNDIPKYTCQHVSANRYCTSAKCLWRNFNFRKSSISASPTTDISSNETTRVICAHRVLDEVFRTVSNETNGNQVYFGSVEGTSRIYPGRDETPCKNYDPRVRPWYLAALYVRKVIMVVIDIGFSMGEPMIAGDDKSENPLAAAQTLTRTLMNTLSGSDFINIMVYNAASATLLASNPVAVNDSNSDTYPPNHPEFDDLTSKLNNTAVGSANAGLSNLSVAMDLAILNMSPFKPEFMKIAIILTNGVLGDSTSPMWKKLKAAGVKTFVYRFQNPDNVDTSISDQQQVCNIGGSYESFPMNRRQNPLFALQSYYSFIANIHTKMNNSLVYGYVYPDYFQADSEIFTISQSAYDRNGVLLGVVGLDIHKNDVRIRLNITDSDFEAETTRRRIAYTFNATRDLVLDSTTCSNQTSAATNGAPNCGSNITNPPNGSLCKANDQSRGIAAFSCCNDCQASTGKNSKKPLIIGLSVGLAGPAVALLSVLIMAGILGVRRYKEYIEVIKIEREHRKFLEKYNPPPTEPTRENTPVTGE